MKVQIDKKNLWEEVLAGRTNYYSYDTLIAVVTAGKLATLYITEERISHTTTKHVNFLKKNLTYNSIRPLEDLAWVT